MHEMQIFFVSNCTTFTFQIGSIKVTAYHTFKNKERICRRKKTQKKTDQFATLNRERLSICLH